MGRNDSDLSTDERRPSNVPNGEVRTDEVRASRNRAPDDGMNSLPSPPVTRRSGAPGAVAVPGSSSRRGSFYEKEKSSGRSSGRFGEDANDDAGRPSPRSSTTQRYMEKVAKNDALNHLAREPQEDEYTPSPPPTPKHRTTQGTKDEKKKRRTLGTPTSSTRNARHDDIDRKKQGPRMSATRDIDDDAVYAAEEGDARRESRAEPPQAAGAYFISEEHGVVSRERGSLTPHPAENNTSSRRVAQSPASGDSARINEKIMLDAAVTVKEVPQDTPWYCTKKFKILAVILVIAAIAIGVVVAVAGGGGGGGSGDKPEPTQPPTRAPAVSRATVIRATLIPLSGAEALDEEGSPQNRAMMWLAMNDTLTPVEESIDDEGIKKLMRRYALVVFYFATAGESWFRNENWLDGEVEECEWEHISCEGGEVVSIDSGTTDNNVVGAIPPEVKAFTSLRLLLLPFNEVSGISSDLGLLTNITAIDLRLNALEGPIPSVLYELASLESLRLDQNQLDGTVGTSIASLSNLKYLSLNTNFFTGTLSTEFQSLVALTDLDIFNNNFRGLFHDVFDGLTDLKVLRVDSNELSGTLPTDISAFTNLVELNLGNNNLATSTIPSEMGLLTNLQGLFLFRNNIGGMIPSELGMLGRLNTFFVEDTLLSGSIPPELCAVFEKNPDTFQLRLPCRVECGCAVCDAQCV